MRCELKFKQLAKIFVTVCNSVGSYAIILDCWKEEPKGRPDFSKLVDTISVTLEAAAGYMDFSLSIKNERPVAAEVEA